MSRCVTVDEEYYQLDLVSSPISFLEGSAKGGGEELQWTSNNALNTWLPSLCLWVLMTALLVTNIDMLSHN